MHPEDSRGWAWTGIVLAVLLAVGGLCFSQWRVAQRTASERRRSNEIIRSLGDLLSYLKDAETGQRGFLLTGDPAFLAPYHSGREAALRETARLHDLLEDREAGGAAGLAPLESLAQAKLEELEASVRTVQGGALAAARAEVAKGEGKRLLDRIRALQEGLLESELGRRQALDQELERSARRTLGLILLLTGLAAAAFLTLSRLRLEDAGRRRSAEAELRDSEAWKSLMVDSVVDYAIFRLDPEGRIASWNAGAERIKGYTEAEVLGQPFDRFYPEEARAAGRPARLLEAAARDGSARDEGWRLRKDGSRFWADVSIAALRDQAGLRGFVKVTRDLTEPRRVQEQLAQSERRFRQLADRAPVGIYLFEPATGVFFANPEYFRQAGLPPGSSRTALRERLHPEDAPRVIRSWEEALEGRGSYAEEYRFAHPDGQVRWIHAQGAPVLDAAGQMEAFIIVAEDITSRRNAEIRLREALHALELRTADLDDANRELEAFAYSVSHDLRAPLRHIDGFVGLLKARLGEGLDAKSAHYLSVVGGAAKQMGALIDDLLAFSRMGRAEVMKVDFELGPLLDKVREELAPEAAGRNIDWRVGALPRVHGDPSLLRLVLLNLLGNALKFTRHTPEPRIEITASRDPEAWSMVVRDNGAGFDMQYADKLFGVFQRLHRQEDFEGTGIGLANVARIVQKHGGRVWADGAVGRGAAFHLSIPLAKGARHA